MYPERVFPFPLSQPLPHPLSPPLPSSPPVGTPSHPAVEVDLFLQEEPAVQRDMAKLVFRRSTWTFVRATDSYLRGYRAQQRRIQAVLDRVNSMPAQVCVQHGVMLRVEGGRKGGERASGGPSLRGVWE